MEQSKFIQALPLSDKKDKLKKEFLSSDKGLGYILLSQLEYILKFFFGAYIVYLLLLSNIYPIKAYDAFVSFVSFLFKVIIVWSIVKVLLYLTLKFAVKIKKHKLVKK